MKNKLLLPALLLLATNSIAQPWAQLVKDGCNGACGFTAFQYAFKNNIFYLGYDEQHSNELWVSDGTSAGTHMLKDINPDPQGESNPLGFIETGGKLFFLARTVSQGMHKIFVTDGTAAGTMSPRDVGYIDKLIPFNGEVYFTGLEGGNSPNKLWKSDGTIAGTVPLTDFPGIISKSAICKHKLFIVAPEMTGFQWLWVTDGTPAGTAKVSNNIAVLQSIGVVNDKFCFHGYDGTNGITGIFVTDGTAAGTEMLDAVPEVYTQMETMNNKIYYLAAKVAHGPVELRASDGTVAGTKTIAQLGTLSITDEHGYNIGSKLLWLTGKGILATDGTQAGTIYIKPSPNSNSGPVVHNNRLYYISGRGYLYASDGTIAGTHNVDSSVFITTNTSNANQNDYRTFMVANNKLYFEAREKILVNGRYVGGSSKVYTNDGTATKAVIPFITTTDTHFDYATIGSDIYLAANDSISGIELWKITDFPTGLQQAKQPQEVNIIYPNPATNTLSVKNSGAIVKIYSFTGQLMLETKETSNINIAHLPAGIYTVHITTGDKTTVEKLVKE